MLYKIGVDLGGTKIEIDEDNNLTITVKEEVKVEEVLAINNVDLASSIMTWKGTKPTGAHDGTIAFKESSLVLDNGKITGGEFIIDMNTIKNVYIINSLTKEEKLSIDTDTDPTLIDPEKKLIKG